MNDNKLTDIQKQYNLLSELEQYFRRERKLTPCVGAEIEFYLHGDIDVSLLKKKIGYEIKAEKGRGQYEVNLEPSYDIADYAMQIKDLRDLIVFSAKEQGVRADFSSKPFLDDYGNAMHIHLNFLEDDDIDKYAQILCHYVSKNLNVYLPNKEDYLRLDSKFMAPTHISYGGNNRSVLIRIPDSEPRRIEHRLAAAGVDPAAVIYDILKSIDKGLKEFKSIKKTPKIFGNAFDQQYDLQKIE